MPRPRPLPNALGPRFSVQQAAHEGVSRGRLRRSDLETPFRGVRDSGAHPTFSEENPYERQAAQRRHRALLYAPRLRPGQFLSHESAIALLDAPLPLVTAEGKAVDGMSLPVHVSTIGSGALVRASGVSAHRAPASSQTFALGDAMIASPATAWAQLGSWPLLDLVALGDHLCRAWRAGPGRPEPGRPPLTTREELGRMLATGRRVGAQRLRDALELIREDSWSPRESKVRCHLVLGGLPEPRLNYDVYDADGGFVACVDLAYPESKTAIEYQSMLHKDQYAADVERLARLRDAGWTVVEVTATLFARPTLLVDRVRRAIRA